ncbi:MAG TPA: chemotaxis protein CheA [Solirubrobacteraceae bacterium]|jgi:two-component system chemotaxis sensor kinase CheA
MDTGKYLTMFLAESREHLQALNLAVVRIEEQPDDRETVDEIFRIAHSMKGMSATMGFDGMAALTHQMEDVFELLRQRSGGLEREAVDVLLRCLDALSAALDAIEADGAEGLAPAPLIALLQGLVRARTPDQQIARRGGEAVPRAPHEVVAALAAGRAVLHARCELSEDVLMPTVRAYMVLTAAAELGAIVASAPLEQDVEAFDGRVVDVWIAAEVEADALHKALTAVPDVALVVVQESAAAGAPAAAQPAAPAPRAATTVRVDAERLDALMHLMGELVVQRTHVEILAAQAEVPGLSQAMQELTRCSHSLQAMVMQVRMIPVEAVFLRFPRLVRDLSGKLGKQVELKLVGQDTELDRGVVDALGDPIVHLLRNALDHGLEGPQEREAAGKPATGTIEISARHAGGNVVITVSDDGRGVDPAAVARKAVARGLLTDEQAASIDAARAIELLFTPGFSTAEATTDISGRGVGTDAVRAKVRELGGEVVMTSEPGRGTTVQIRLPLTLAIMSALLVNAGGRPYGIAIDRVDRTVRLADHTVRSAAGRRMLVMRDSLLPLHDAAGALGHEPEDDCEFAVIVHGRERSLALAVSGLIGQRELVTRPLPPDVAELAPVSGAAVLSDGEIALLIDCDALTTDDAAPALARAA